LLGVVAQSPLQMLILGGILNGLYLMAVSVSTIYLSCRQTDPRIKDGHLFTVYLLVSAVEVFAVGMISLFDSSDPARSDRRSPQPRPVLGRDR
jgi:O-antigen ligase